MIIAAFAVQGIRIDLAGEQEDRHRVCPALGNPGERIHRPGPAVVQMTPGLPVTLAEPSAAKAPACSLRVSIVRIEPERASAS